jgi:membrane protease YdiL (CAAX protease family)
MLELFFQTKISFSSSEFLLTFFKATVEEVIFRFLLINFLLGYFNNFKSLIISSVLFSLAHFSIEPTATDYIMLLARLISGYYMGRAYLSTSSLVAPITLHTVFNLSILFFTSVRNYNPSEFLIIIAAYKIAFLCYSIIKFKSPQSHNRLIF